MNFLALCWTRSPAIVAPLTRGTTYLINQSVCPHPKSLSQRARDLNSGSPSPTGRRGIAFGIQERGMRDSWLAKYMNALFKEGWGDRALTDDAVVRGKTP
jgi:hypothetical protein